MADPQDETTPASFIWARDTWQVIDAMMRQDERRPEVCQHLFDHQIESYNFLIQTVLAQLISRHLGDIKEYHQSSNGPTTIYEIAVKSAHIAKPALHEDDNTIEPMYPRTAKLRNLTYASPVFVDIYHRIYQEGETAPPWTIERKNLFTRIPVMVNSIVCNIHNLTNTTLRQLGESAYDPGGYFIIKGSEKIVIPQEGTAENMYYCFETNRKLSGPAGNAASQNSSIWTNDTTGAMCQIKSTMDHNFYRVETNEVLINRTNNLLKVKISGLREPIPLFIVFRALNYTADQDIIELIMGSFSDPMAERFMEVLNPSCEEASQLGIYTYDKAVEYMAARCNINLKYVPKTMDLMTFKIQRLHEVIRERLLPHAGISYTGKATNLAHMTRILINCLLGRRQFDDRDHLRNKRLDLVGVMMAHIVRSNLINLQREVRNKLQEHMETQKGIFPSLRQTLNSNNIENRLIYALNTGNWITGKSLQERATSKKGIAQPLKRMSYIDTFTHLRRVQSPLDQKGAKLVQPRLLHTSQIGHNCINESPEGQQIGIVKNLALSAHITIHANPTPILVSLQQIMGKHWSTNHAGAPTHISILVNGNLVTTVPNQLASKIYQLLRIQKRHGLISPFVSISWSYEYGEILIFTDGGRYGRPLLVINPKTNQLLIQERWHEIQPMMANLPPAKRWWALLRGHQSPSNKTAINGGVLEYMDMCEQECNLVAISPFDIQRSFEDKMAHRPWRKYTYCEIHPSLWHGAIGSLIPLPDHHPSARNIFSCQMCKQALGTYDPMWYDRLDHTAHILLYPMRPLFTTKYVRYLGINYLHHGAQAMLAIMSHSGYNQEDSLLLNLSSLQRGFMSSLYIRTYEASIRNQKGGPTKMTERFGIPPMDGRLKDGKKSAADSYANIIDTSSGLPRMGAKVDEDSIIISKYQVLPEGGAHKYRDTSVQAKGPGYITRVASVYDEDGHLTVKVRQDKYRIPIVGDKFASREAQKGTCGAQYRISDMPFSANGFTPDIVMNPHAYPRRMTVGMLQEGQLSKLSLQTGLRYDATAFSEFHSHDSYEQQLESFHFQRYGDEVMYSGKTGEQLRTECCVVPCFYQRLKHMVEDKLHARATGPIQLLTRQPAEGRSRDGGHRIGEMERDCFIAHGVAHIILERMVLSSDLYRVYSSKQSQAIIPANPDRRFFQWGGKDIIDDTVVELQVPYAFVLLIRELQSAGIDMRLESDG